MIDFVLIYQNLDETMNRIRRNFSLFLHFQSFDDTDTLRGVNVIPSSIQFTKYNLYHFRLIDRPLDEK